MSFSISDLEFQAISEAASDRLRSRLGTQVGEQKPPWVDISMRMQMRMRACMCMCRNRSITPSVRFAAGKMPTARRSVRRCMSMFIRMHIKCVFVYAHLHAHAFVYKYPDVCMYIHVWVRDCASVYIYIYIYIYIWVCVLRARTCVRACACACLRARARARACVCLCVCVCARACVCVCVFVCVCLCVYIMYIMYIMHVMHVNSAPGVHQRVGLHRAIDDLPRFDGLLGTGSRVPGPGGQAPRGPEPGAVPGRARAGGRAEEAPHLIHVRLAPDGLF